jgi:hypothetical protein
MAPPLDLADAEDPDLHASDTAARDNHRRSRRMLGVM